MTLNILFNFHFEGGFFKVVEGPVLFVGQVIILPSPNQKQRRFEKDMATATVNLRSPQHMCRLRLNT